MEMKSVTSIPSLKALRVKIDHIEQVSKEVLDSPPGMPRMESRAKLENFRALVINDVSIWLKSQGL